MIRIRLSSPQWRVLSSAFSNISQAVILFSAASFFVHEAVGLSNDFSRITSISFFLIGIVLLGIAVIITEKGE